MKHSGFDSKARYSTAVLLTVLLTACGPSAEDVNVPSRDVPQTSEELETVRTVFNAVQPDSIARDRVYCGYIVRTDLGLLEVTSARRGRSDKCSPRRSRRDVEVLASYRTGAAYSTLDDREVPAYDDLVGAITEATDGYIATPAGRIWHLNASEKHARLMCERHCVASDPAYQPGFNRIIRDRYTLNDLFRREN